MKHFLSTLCLATVILAGLPFTVSEVQACTSAVISGRATPDGRPLLWKHRDTGFLRNHIAYVHGEKYDFIANVNSDNFPEMKEAWIGTNSAGFALMNTQSYNLVKVKEDEERGEANGRIIYRALEVCATVDDFRQFLDTLSKPSMIEANFGVIDARGGAAMFEVDYYRYVMYDANDPQVAPHGYIVRTNFSTSGKEGEGAGYVRYLEAEPVTREAAIRKEVTPQFIFNRLSRSFRNRQLGIDLQDEYFNTPASAGWFVDQDFIPRGSTSCSIVIQGVRPADGKAKGESPELTTMWTLLGYPPTGIAVPLWVKEGADALPAIVCKDESVSAAPLSHYSLTLRNEVFSLHKGMGTDRYLHWQLLWNRQGTGYMQRLAPIEEEVFRRTEPLLEKWRSQGKINAKEMNRFYRELQDYLKISLPYSNQFPIMAEEGILKLESATSRTQHRAAI